MTINDISTRLNRVLTKECSVKEVFPRKTLTEHGFDSLDWLYLRTELEAEFDLDLPIETFQTKILPTTTVAQIEQVILELTTQEKNPQ